MKKYLEKITDVESYNWLLNDEEMSQLYHNEITPDELRAKHFQPNVSEEK